jgi:hypothetical protein
MLYVFMRLCIIIYALRESCHPIFFECVQWKQKYHPKFMRMQWKLSKRKFSGRVVERTRPKSLDEEGA